MLERALEAELTVHLGYERHDRAGHGTGNSRNGSIGKTVQTGTGRRRHEWREPHRLPLVIWAVSVLPR